MTLWSHRDHSAAAAYRYASAETTIGTTNRAVNLFYAIFLSTKKIDQRIFFLLPFGNKNP
jgi:hypothetical protein